MKILRTALVSLLLCLGCPQLPAFAAEAAASTAVRESVAVTIRDSRLKQCTLRIPTALHRPANRFRLYGLRPLTLWSYGYRRDLYRDAFLELATRSLLSPSESIWDAAGRTGDRLLQKSGLSNLPAAGMLNLQVADESLLKAGGPDSFAAISAPLRETLELRALATELAENRLRRAGSAVESGGSSIDPAMRDGYRAALREFENLRKDLWPALIDRLKKHGGRIVLSSIRDFAMSHLGFWAIFGHLGWNAAGALLTDERQAQLAIVYSSLAERLPGSDPDLVSYADYLTAYSLTEALKGGRLLDLKPAGGRSQAEWRLHLGQRADDLRQKLTAPAPPALAPAS